MTQQADLCERCCLQIAHALSVHRDNPGVVFAVVWQCGACGHTSQVAFTPHPPAPAPESLGRRALKEFVGCSILFGFGLAAAVALKAAGVLP